ncbi:response regulator/pilus assembly protein [Salipiger sp. PrR002]|uniref:response regulator/pilus assembly protein n=1 Tax=Salipiger sp. PrR002 TaxID=2706489 RepID=UPI0013B81573|nr:response regulator/pilus assembly protein [Salipiger sp. PrR002]NDW01110.1 response regulator/pilus assembly protein [Salipiger sp. PrR002]NDW57913.1 response regulator/pilus assembly protein [Salipiger sp. PrR004]
MNMTVDGPKAIASIPMTRIMVLTGEGADSAEVAALVEFSPRLTVTQLAAAHIREQLSGGGGDLIIANLQTLSDAEMTVLSDIRSLAPQLPLIVVTPQLSPEETRRLFKLDIHDWLPKPLQAGDLIESIQKSMRARQTGSNSVHAVVSCVGGAGATTLALSMADRAATQLVRKRGSVALFDLDFSLGNCGYAINMVNEFNLGSVAATPRRVDPEFMKVIQKKHPNGFFLYSFKRPELNTELNGYELVLRMLDAVSAEHDHTFLDIPYYETEWKEDVFSAVNSFTLVCELNLPSIKHTLDQIERIRALRGKDVPVHVLINKHESSLFGQRIGTRRLRELFEETPFHFVPLAKGQISQALDRGVLPSEVSKRSRFLKALTKYMKAVQMTAEIAK